MGGHADNARSGERQIRSTFLGRKEVNYTLGILAIGVQYWGRRLCLGVQPYVGISKDMILPLSRKSDILNH